jgi:hypothetical protein
MTDPLDAPTAAPRPLRLFGHMELANLEALDPAQAALDAYSISQTVPSMDHPKLQALRARGIKIFRYINILTRPLEGWVAGSPWFKYLWDFRSAGPLANSDGVPAIYPWFGQPTLWTWHKLANAKRDQLRRRINDLVPAGDGLWLDLTYRQPPYWAFSAQGAAYSDFNEILWTAWQRNITAFLAELRTLDGRKVLCNGDNLAPQPCFFERADWTIEATWDEHVALWKQHPDNVLAVFATSSRVPDLIAEWKRSGGWIAFTGDEPEVRQAYAQALAAKQEVIDPDVPSVLTAIADESLSVSGRIGLWNMCSGVHAQGAVV